MRVKGLNAHLTWPISCLIHTRGRISPHRCPQLQFLVRPLANTFLSTKGLEELLRSKSLSTKGHEGLRTATAEGQGQNCNTNCDFFCLLWTAEDSNCRGNPSARAEQKKSPAVDVLQLLFLPLPLTFFAVLRGPSWTKRSCRCRSSRPFVDKGVAVTRPTLGYFAQARAARGRPLFARAREINLAAHRIMAGAGQQKLIVAHRPPTLTLVRPILPGQTGDGVRRWRNGRSCRQCDRKRRGGEFCQFRK